MWPAGRPHRGRQAPQDGARRFASDFPLEWALKDAVDRIDLAGCTHDVRGYQRSACAHLIEEVAQDLQIFIDVTGLVGETGVWPGA